MEVSGFPRKGALPEGIVSGNGRIESIQVDVAAKYGGRIKEILASEGDLVAEGQVLARMDTVELEADLAKGKAKVAEAEADASEATRPSPRSKAKRNWRSSSSHRSQDLYARGSSLEKNTTSR